MNNPFSGHVFGPPVNPGKVLPTPPPTPDVAEAIQDMVGPLLIDPGQVESLREIRNFTDQAEKIAALSNIFERTLSADGDELFNEQNIDAAEEHLGNLDALDNEWDPYNRDMLNRQRGISRGEIEPTQYDRNWLRHELIEKDLMSAGASYNEAHQTAKDVPGVAGDWDLWPTEMIDKHSDTLSNSIWENEIEDR